MKKITDFDLNTYRGRHQARKAGFDVPKRKTGVPCIDFESMFKKTEGCWEWLGTKCSAGYGCFNCNRKKFLAHRESYKKYKGPIPPGMLVRHSCDNPICVNPDHLSIGTYKDNSDDKVERGRQAKGESNGFAKLTEKQVLEMRSLYSFRKVTYKDLAKKYGVHLDTVKKAVRGVYWKYLNESS